MATLAAGGKLAPVRHLGVRSMPASGTPEELLEAAGIDATAIAAPARRLLGAGAHVAAAERMASGG